MEFKGKKIKLKKIRGEMRMCVMMVTQRRTRVTAVVQCSTCRQKDHMWYVQS